MMKTLFKTISLFVCIVFATQSQAQSQEKTITWLKKNFIESKVGAVGSSKEINCKIEEITSCYIKISYDSYDLFSQFEGRFTAKLPLKVKLAYGVYLEYDNDVVEITMTDGRLFHKGGLIFSITTENNEQLVKKMNHLATFCK